MSFYRNTSASNKKIIKAMIPFTAFMIIGTFGLSKFLDEKFYREDLKKQSKSIAEVKDDEHMMELELLKIQANSTRDWTQVPIPGIFMKLLRYFKDRISR